MRLLARVRTAAVIPASALLLGTAASAAAQEGGTLTGQIINEVTGQGIGAAQVSLVGTSLGTVAGPNGRYLIPNVPPGTYDVQVMRIAFGSMTQQATISVGETTVLDFQLGQQAVSLEEVVVTGTAGAARRREIGNSIASIDSRLLERKPVQDVST